MAETIVKLRRCTTLSWCDGHWRLRAAVDGVARETGDQLALDQIGLSRIRDCHAMANRCCGGVTVADFALKWPLEP